MSQVSKTAAEKQKTESGDERAKLNQQICTVTIVAHQDIALPRLPDMESAIVGSADPDLIALHEPCNNKTADQSGAGGHTHRENEPINLPDEIIPLPKACAILPAPINPTLTAERSISRAIKSYYLRVNQTNDRPYVGCSTK